MAQHHYRHKKRGTAYTELGRGHLNCADPAFDRKEVVIYQSKDTGSLEVRPVSEFDDGRFERFIPCHVSPCVKTEDCLSRGYCMLAL